MSSPRAFYHIVRADFLERARRYSFLLTLGVSIYLGYAVYAGQIGLQVGRYRGVQNAAWTGSVMAIVASMFLSLIGFYVVKNTIQRDRDTRVGMILAATPMSRMFYVCGKALSNFAVLAAMVLILALVTVLIQVSQRQESGIHILALLGPILTLGLCPLVVTAALAVLFETIPGLRGGFGNAAYVFIWVGLGVVAGTMAGATYRYFGDYTGIGVVLDQMQEQVRQLDPLSHGSRMFAGGAGPNASTRTFLWTGVHWNATLVLSRLSWLGVAAALAALAGSCFDRFDPARARWIAARRSDTASSLDAGTSGNTGLPGPRPVIVHLTPLAALGPHTGPHSRFLALVLAELRLLLRGQPWWWYAAAAGLFIACLASPLPAARAGVISAAWLWPLLLWSQLGTREAQFSTRSLIFSAPRAFPRQLLAMWAAGVGVAALTGGGLGVHLLLAGDAAGLQAWAAATLFIPALALALGVCTESRKTFEALYTVWWYLGPLQHVAKLDFIGTTPATSTPLLYVVASALLLIVACAWRGVRLATA